MKVTKQSLKDWQVTDNGKPYAWISKVRFGYEVTFKGLNGSYFFISFKEAKQFAIK